MKRIIGWLLAVVLVTALVACGSEPQPPAIEEPDLLPQLESYIEAKTKELRQKFGMEDLEIVVQTSKEAPISISKHRVQETDVGEYTVRLRYYISAPSFVADLLVRQADRNLTYDDILLGENLMYAFTLDDFAVENYENARASSCTCTAIIGSEDNMELTFRNDPIGDFGYGEITKRWNLDKTPYDWDMIFYYNDRLERIYYSKAEYEENALPPAIDREDYCKKCGRRALLTNNDYCATCVKIYVKEWYIDWDGEVSIG